MPGGTAGSMGPAYTSSGSYKCRVRNLECGLKSSEQQADRMRRARLA